MSIDGWNVGKTTVPLVAEPILLRFNIDGWAAIATPENDPVIIKFVVEVVPLIVTDPDTDNDPVTSNDPVIKADPVYGNDDAFATYEAVAAYDADVANDELIEFKT